MLSSCLFVVVEFLAPLLLKGETASKINIKQLFVVSNFQINASLKKVPPLKRETFYKRCGVFFRESTVYLQWLAILSEPQKQFNGREYLRAKRLRATFTRKTEESLGNYSYKTRSGSI